MEHYGSYVGIYFEGRQIGAGRRWKLTRIPMSEPDSERSVSHNNPGVIIMKGWVARVLSYHFEEKVKGRELEFRFANQFMYFKTLGTILADIKVGGNIGEELKMEGSAPVAAIFPK